MSQYLRHLKRRLRELEQRAITDGSLPLIVIGARQPEPYPIITVQLLGEGASREVAVKILRRIIAEYEAGHHCDVDTAELQTRDLEGLAGLELPPLAGEGGGG